MTTKTKLVVKNSHGQQTDTFAIMGDHGHGPMIRGDAQAALDMLREKPYYTEVRLYRGGRFVAGVKRDGTVWRP